MTWPFRNGRISSTRTLGVVAVTLAAVVAVPAGGAAADEAAPSTGTEEYVVAFTGSAEAATAAIRGAGGTVEDVTAQVGLARVQSANTRFLDDVRARGGVTGAARNQSVGTVRPGMPHRYVTERPQRTERGSRGGSGGAHAPRPGAGTEPLADRQWDMAMIGAQDAQRRATGRGVDVGIIDTGIDGSHPDIAPNFDRERSRNFVTDLPEIDGPCEAAGCVDPVDEDDNGHGTHVAGTVAAADNGFGIGGVAPEATLVNVRAGQDSGYFFLYETVKALVYAADQRLDVVNMSFYTDPWLYLCSSRDEYLEGEVSDEEIAEQQFTRQLILAATAYAHQHGVTMVSAAGNDATDLAAPTRADATSPDTPPGTARPRTVANTCLNLPTEAPDVISVSAVGPSTTKADYSNYGLGDVDLAAPGGWFSDNFGTPDYGTPGNLVLSSYPLHVAIAQGLADAEGNPVDPSSVRYCDAAGTCGFYTYLQGTSMASPHVAGVAALVIQRYGKGSGGGGRSLDPDTVAGILAASASDHACPAGGVEDYTDEGAPQDNAVCEGTTGYNGLYGEGIVNAAAAVRG